MEARQWRWTGVVVVTCICLTALLWVSRGWVWLGVPPINAERSPISDTLVHVGTAVNCGNGLGEWYGSACFVPDTQTVPRAQTYEPWLTFYRLGLDSNADAHIVAVLMIALFFVAMGATFRPRTPGSAALLLALLFTPAVQLCVERGNFDLLIAALLCLAGAQLAQPRPRGALAGIAVLSLATMLKLYTGLACALAWLVARVRQRFAMPAAAIGVSVAVAVVGVRELRVLGQGAPEGETRFSTGARWLFEQMGVVPGIAAVVLAAIAGAIAWRLLRQQPDGAFTRWPRRTAVFQVAFLTAVPLFLLKNSYDYRFVLWLPCLALPFAWLSCAAGIDRRLRALAVSAFVLFLLATGMELPLTWLDARHGEPAVRTLATALVFAKQAATWMLAALLAAMFVRAVAADAPPRRVTAAHG
jgi:hypothetical protein